MTAYLYFWFIDLKSIYNSWFSSMGSFLLNLYISVLKVIDRITCTCNWKFGQLYITFDNINICILLHPISITNYHFPNFWLWNDFVFWFFVLLFSNSKNLTVTTIRVTLIDELIQKCILVAPSLCTLIDFHMIVWKETWMN